jgi:acyl-CoA synthetase (AMP-forming)/AMP-acid ligase II
MSEGTSATDPQPEVEGADTPLPATYNFADLWEAVWPRAASRTALVCGPQRPTYRELAERANRLAHHLRAAGVGPGDKVALFLKNDQAYLEAMIAAFTLRAATVNINHRYTGEELRALLEDSGSVAMVVHRSLTALVATVADSVADMKAILVVDDPVPTDSDPDPVDLPGAVGYEEALAASSPDPVVTEGRSGEDLYLMYTGGTTGRPKGVVWRQDDAYFACIGGGDPMRLLGPVGDPSEVIDRMVAGFVYLPLAPLMHAAAQWTTWSWLLAGGTTVLMPGSLDPEAVWDAVADEGVNSLTVIGDAVGPSHWSRHGRTTPTVGT